MKPIHKAVEIDPEAFADHVPIDTVTGEYVFDDADVLIFLIDAMNTAKINISMVNHDHGFGIEYMGKRDNFSIGIPSRDAPERAVVNGIAEISYIINDHKGIESWMTYMNGKFILSIEQQVIEQVE